MRSVPPGRAERGAGVEGSAGPVPSTGSIPPHVSPILIERWTPGCLPQEWKRTAKGAGHPTAASFAPTSRGQQRVPGLGSWLCRSGVSLQCSDGPFEGAETDSPFAPVWGSAWELAPYHRGVTTGRGRSLCGPGLCVGQACLLAGQPETMGGCGPGPGAGIAGWQRSRTDPQRPSCASACTVT